MIETADSRKDRLRPCLKRSGVIAEILKTILFVVVVTVLFDMIIPRSEVKGASMSPTFEETNRLIVSRLNYMLGLPSRGDIVVFNSVNPREPYTMLIKRVIGLPGETLEFRDTKVYINGVRLDETYIREDCSSLKCPDEVIQLGTEEYFMMGDNRNNSNDSRAFARVVTIHDIVGEVIFRYWPPSEFGLITGFNYNQ